MMLLAVAVSALVSTGQLVDLEVFCQHGGISVPMVTRMLDGVTDPLKAAGLDDGAIRRSVRAGGGALARYSDRMARSDYLVRSGNLRQPTFQVREEAIVVGPSGAGTLYVRLTLQKNRSAPHLIWLAFESAAKEPICVTR
jgi:hypothetical protein